MKRYIAILVLIWIMTACARQPQSNAVSYPNDSYPNSSYPNGGKPPVDLTPAESAAITALSQSLSLPADRISVISTEAVDWRDGCLGVQKMGVMCTQAIVPGYKIILQAKAKQYEYHTNKNGSQIVEVGEAVAAGKVEEITIKQLASNLGLKENKISVISSSDIKFADSCLGVAMQNIECAQSVTAGKIIVLESDGIQYEYHVSNDGKQVQPATLALTWTREGGIAGFCDSLTVFLSGEVYGNQCKSQPNETMKTFATLLSSAERGQFNIWFNDLGKVSVDASDPKGVSDRMEVKLAFYGNGKATTLGKPDEQALFLWAQNLYQKLYP